VKFGLSNWQVNKTRYGYHTTWIWKVTINSTAELDVSRFSMWPVVTGSSHTRARCMCIELRWMVNTTMELCMYLHANRNRVYLCSCSILLYKGIHAKLSCFCCNLRNNVLIWLKLVFMTLESQKWLHNMLLLLLLSHPTHLNTSPFARWISI
jgi:hypothetical protein